MAALAIIVPLVIACAGVPFLQGGDEWRKSYGVFAWVLAAHWLIMLYFAWLVFRGREELTALPLPKVRTYQKQYGYIITEPSAWLGQGMIVSIYRTEEQFERFLFLGRVENVQENKLIAVRPLAEDDEQKADIAGFANRSDFSDILIKPGFRSLDR